MASGSLACHRRRAIGNNALETCHIGRLTCNDGAEIGNKAGEFVTASARQNGQTILPKAGSEWNMDHADFRIGIEFESGAGTWRCTDIGTRTVTAIRIDRVEKATHHDGKIETVTLSRDQAEAEEWFTGPPYLVAEIVFDEEDFEGCTAVS